MKNKKLLFICLSTCLLVSSSIFAQSTTFIKEGKWRGVFKLNETEVPFNFEVKGKSAEDAIFTLINGSRRDDFHIKQIGTDSLFIKMNTYDAALIAKIEPNGQLKRCLVDSS